MTPAGTAKDTGARPAPEAVAASAEATQEAHCAPRANIEPPTGPVAAARETGARPRVPERQQNRHPWATPNPHPVPRSIILLPEPYPNWRERLVGLFRALNPEEEAGRPIPGYVGQVYIQKPRSESYLVSAKYDVHARGGNGIRWMRVVEALIRGMRLDMQRHPITFEPLPVKKTEKATCGIRVALKPLSMAHNGL